MSISLWGEIPLEDTIQTPKAILETQAQELTSQTNGLLEGAVVVEASRSREKVLLRLYIRVPALNNYMYDIGTFSYPLVEFYPCRVIDSDDGEAVTVGNEAEFNEALKELLQSERVSRAIRGLLAQART